jgi:hypothetical protein
MYKKMMTSSTTATNTTKTSQYTHRHENSWRHWKHASGTNSRKMRNHYAEGHKSASILLIAFIYEATIDLFLGITSILRLFEAEIASMFAIS